MSSRHTPTTHRPTRVVLPDTGELESMSLRELLQALAYLEETLSHLHRSAAERSGPLPSPQQQQVLLCQRAVLHELRRRRTARLTTSRDEGRPQSAAWPPPPWG